MAVEDDVNKFGDASDNSKKNDNLSSSSKLNLSFGDTLHLHPNDTGSLPIVTIKLTGKKYYKILNSLSPDLFVGDTYAKTDFEMWNDLKETYDNVDGSAMFNYG
ncbi:hypothetical protein Tco_0453222 [Tanacetum coccineum]